MKPLIPEAAIKRHMAILGMNGSAKTSVAKEEIVEPALANDERACMVDPTGVWWGLRLGADGAAKGGFKVYIVGGEHADFPLTKRDGAAWAEIVGTSSDSFIFDTSLMTVTDRTTWFTAFAETLLRKNKGPLKLILDEAHLFAPQGGARAGGLAPDMLHATNNLLALGRSKGLRITMITQRPAKLHKDALTQAHTLIAMKLVAPQDRNAIKDWVADQTDPESGKELIASLPTLKPGEGWIWAPAENILQRAQFPRPRTYDSSSAPDDDQAEGPKLVPIDPAAVTARLATVSADAVSNDPGRLKKRVTELERDLVTALASPMIAVDPKAIEDAERRGADLAMRAVAKIVTGLSDSIERAEVACADAKRLLSSFSIFIETQAEKIQKRTVAAPFVPSDVKENRFYREPAPKPATSISKVDVNLTGPQSQLLSAIAWWKAMGHAEPTRTQVAAIAGWKPKGSNLRNRLSELSSRGMVTYPREGCVRLTDDGIAAAPAPDTARTLLDSIRAVLTAPQLSLFDALVDSIDNRLTRPELAATVGWEASGSNLRNRLSELSSLELVEYPAKGEVALQEWVTT